MNLPESYLSDCFIKGREGETLFVITPELQVLARLKGYAVIPAEEYEALMARHDLATSGLVDRCSVQLSYTPTLKSWKELAEAVREKARRLTTVAGAFERYDREGEPFIGESMERIDVSSELCDHTLIEHHPGD